MHSTAYFRIHIKEHKLVWNISFYWEPYGFRQKTPSRSEISDIHSSSRVIILSIHVQWSHVFACHVSDSSLSQKLCADNEDQWVQDLPVLKGNIAGRASCYIHQYIVASHVSGIVPPITLHHDISLTIYVSLMTHSLLQISGDLGMPGILWNMCEQHI